MTGLANGNSFANGSSYGGRPIPDWSLQSVPPWKFGLRQSDDRGGM